MERLQVSHSNVSFAQIKLVARKFSTSQADPNLPDNKDHPVQEWCTKTPIVRKFMVGQHPLIVGLAFLDKNYAVHILSAPCPDMTSFEEGSKLGGSLGDETIVGNPVAMD